MKAVAVRALHRLDLYDFAVSAFYQAKLTRRRATRTDMRIVRRYLAEQPGPKLHIGAGPHVRDGWLNTNWRVLAPGSIHLDATRRFPFADGTFDLVHSEHMIEHVPYTGGKAMLAECFRVLRGGRAHPHRDA